MLPPHELRSYHSLTKPRLLPSQLLFKEKSPFRGNNRCCLGRTAIEHFMIVLEHVVGQAPIIPEGLARSKEGLVSPFIKNLDNSISAIGREASWDNKLRD